MIVTDHTGKNDSTNVEEEAIIDAIDIKDSIYEVPVLYENQGLTNVIIKKLKLNKQKGNLDTWKKLVNVIKNSKHHVNVAVVGIRRSPLAIPHRAGGRRGIGDSPPLVCGLRPADSHALERAGAEARLSAVPAFGHPRSTCCTGRVRVSPGDRGFS